MLALTVTGVVNADHTLTLPVPANLLPGPRQVVVVIQDESAPAQKRINFDDWPAHDVALANPNDTFRREDLYGDDGR